MPTLTEAQAALVGGTRRPRTDPDRIPGRGYQRRNPAGEAQGRRYEAAPRSPRRTSRRPTKRPSSPRWPTKGPRPISRPLAAAVKAAQADQACDEVLAELPQLGQDVVFALQAVEAVLSPLVAAVRAV